MYRGISAMCTNRNETDVTVTLASGLMVGANAQETGIFALSTRVRLGGNSGKSTTMIERFILCRSLCTL